MTIPILTTTSSSFSSSPMASSTSSPLLGSPHFSCRFVGCPIPSPKTPLGLPVPPIKVHSRRRFAAARCEVALVPARLLRPPCRRRNALREKASPLLGHQVRPPYHEALESDGMLNKNLSMIGGVGKFGSRSSLDHQVPKSGSLDEEPLSDLDDKLGSSGGLDAARSGNVSSESNLDGEKDMVGDAEEERHFRGTGISPVFNVYEDPEGNVVHVEVDEDEIIIRSETAKGAGVGDLEAMLSRVRVIAKEVESGERQVPKNSSLFQFLVVGRKESPVVGAEVSVIQRNEPPLRGFAWSGFAALCGVCIVFVASRLIWRDGKTQLSRKLLDMLRPGMEGSELDKGNIKVLRNVQQFPGGLLRRPQLDRNKLMNNIKRGKESRERFVLSNVFGLKTVANDDDTNIKETMRMVTEVHTLEEGTLEQSNTEKKNCDVFLHPIAVTEEEVSSSCGSQSVYPDDVSDSSRLSGVSYSNDIIEENVEQSAYLKNGKMAVEICVKNQNNVEQLELSKPISNDKGMTDANNKTCEIYMAGEEAHIGSATDHSVAPNSINSPSSEFRSKEPFAQIGVNNLDYTQGIKPYMPISSGKQMIDTKDNAQQISINVVSETADGLSSDCINNSSSELKNKEASLDVSVNDLKCIQETEAPKQMAHCKEFAHKISITGIEACTNSVMADISTKKSPQRNREEPVIRTINNVQCMQELKPSSSTGDDKQMIHVEEKNHKIRTVSEDAQISSVTDNTGTLDNASTSSLHFLLQEETVQHKAAKISTSEKQEKITSSNKEAREYLTKNKSKLQKEVCTDKETKKKESAKGAPRTSTVIDPPNGVQKTKRVQRKQLKKVQSDQEVTARVTAQEDVQSSSMVDLKNNSRNAKRTRRKNLKNAFGNQGAQTREESPETGLMITSPDNVPTDANMKPLGGAGSSVETQNPKDAFREAQPNGFSVCMTRKEEKKLTFDQTLERVEAAVVEAETNTHGDKITHERSTDINLPKIGVTAVKKSTKRKPLSKRSKSSNSYRL